MLIQSILITLSPSQRTVVYISLDMCRYMAGILPIRSKTQNNQSSMVVHYLCVNTISDKT